MADYFDRTGKAAVVTGGASGIGAAIAQRLRGAGASVLIADLTDATEQARDWGCDFRRADVSIESEIAALLDEAVTRYGKLGILVSNAAIANVHRSEEHTSELQSLMRISYAVFCLKKKTNHKYTSHIQRATHH